MSLVSSSNLILSSFSCLIAHSEKITHIDQFDLGNFLTKCIALVDETATTSLVSKAFRDYTLQAYPLIAKAYRKNQNDRPKLENIWLCFFVDKFFIKHRVNQDSLPESYRLVVNDIRKFVTL